METKVRLTVQEIVDLYWLEKDYAEMTQQIDIYGPSDFWYEIKEQFEECQNNIDDWSIYTGMVFEYHTYKEEVKATKDEIKKEVEHKKREELLLKFSEWIIGGIEIVNIDKDQIEIQINDFLEELEDEL